MDVSLSGSGDRTPALAGELCPARGHPAPQARPGEGTAQGAGHSGAGAGDEPGQLQAASPLAPHHPWTLPGSAGPCRPGTESEAQCGGHRWLQAWRGPHPSHRPLCHTLSSVSPALTPQASDTSMSTVVPRPRDSSGPVSPSSPLLGSSSRTVPKAREPSRRTVRPWASDSPRALEDTGRDRTATTGGDSGQGSAGASSERPQSQWRPGCRSRASGAPGPQPAALDWERVPVPAGG